MHIITSISGKKVADRENGASVVDLNFINLAAADGHKVTVIVPEERANGITPNSTIKVIYIGLTIHGPLWQAAKLLRTARELLRLYRSAPEVIFRTNSFFSSLLEVIPLLLLSGGKARLFIQFHHKDHSRLRNLIARPVLRRARVIVCPSHAARQELIEMLGFVPQGLHMVHHGVAEKFFQARSQYTPMQAIVGEPALRLLFVGHLERRKNPLALLTLAKALYGKVNFEMAIVGTGPEMANLQEIIFGQPWATAVSFLGEVSDEEKLKEYALSDLFVFPSKQEGFGLVLCEAMAAGIPILAFDTSAMPEIVQPGTGYLVPVDDTNAMVTIILKLAHDRLLLQELSKSAIDHARTHFHWQNKVAQICHHLKATFPP